uniref:Ribosome-recycling factor, mitochondrial n=1 Tax=Parastrongyloides trichosuri TaxID=131310 RepID=A0A0N4ZMM8_PARTI
MIRRCLLLSKSVNSLQNVTKITSSSIPINFLQIRDINLTIPVLKVKKGTKNKNVKEENFHIDPENTIVIDAQKEMDKIEKVLVDELSKHFSLQVDLRVFEDILVQLDDGTTKKMNHLGRVSCKSAHMVMINFSDNPSAISNAKIALQKSSLNVTPQQEGVVLHINIPRMTRERREKLANIAKTKIFNDYKNALNDIYVKADKKSTKISKTIDIAKNNRTSLLALKKLMENKGLAIVEAKQRALLNEVA